MRVIDEPDPLGNQVDARSDALIAEFEQHFAELIRLQPKHANKRDQAFQGWIIQKVAGLQLCITELENRLAESSPE